MVQLQVYVTESEAEYVGASVAKGEDGVGQSVGAQVGWGWGGAIR